MSGAAPNVLELYSEYITLALQRTRLDAHIAAQPGSASIPARDDHLWLQLNQVLTRQTELVNALVERQVESSEELKAKAQILARLLQAGDPVEGELAMRLSLSVTRDIATLLH